MERDEILKHVNKERFDKHCQGQEMLRKALAEDIEEYHRLVNQKMETFSWDVFAGFLLSKGWTHKNSYLIFNPPECYSCGQEVKVDEKGHPECYCHECLPEDNPYHLKGQELKRTEEARKRGE